MLPQELRRATGYTSTSVKAEGMASTLTEMWHDVARMWHEGLGIES